jgi:hypothetical protein
MCISPYSFTCIFSVRAALEFILRWNSLLKFSEVPKKAHIASSLLTGLLLLFTSIPDFIKVSISLSDGPSYPPNFVPQLKRQTGMKAKTNQLLINPIVTLATVMFGHTRYAHNSSNPYAAAFLSLYRQGPVAIKSFCRKP